MNSLNQLELQNIRHLVGMLSNVCAKTTYYKTLTTDQGLTGLFNDITTHADTIKKEVSNLL